MIARLTVLLLFVALALGAQVPQSFDEVSDSARKAYEAGHLDDALALFNRGVSLNPDWAPGWWAIGMIEYDRDRYAECRDALSHLIKLDRAATAGFALLGLCEFRTKQFDESFNHLKQAHMLVRVDQPSGPLLELADYHLVLLLNQRGAFEVSQSVLLRLARSVQDNPNMKFAAGLAALRISALPAEIPKDQTDPITLAGKTFWDLATRPPEEGEADFKKLVATYPKFPNVHYFYGTYLAARDPEHCIPEFLQELAVSPDSVPARVQLSLRYAIEGKYDEALKMAREAVKLSPDSVGSQLALGKVLQARGEHQAAIAPLQEAERLDPDSPAIRLLILNSYRALHMREDMQREAAVYDKLKAANANWP